MYMQTIECTQLVCEIKNAISIYIILMSSVREYARGKYDRESAYQFGVYFDQTLTHPTVG